MSQAIVQPNIFMLDHASTFDSVQDYTDLAQNKMEFQTRIHSPSQARPRESPKGSGIHPRPNEEKSPTEVDSAALCATVIVLVFDYFVQVLPVLSLFLPFWSSGIRTCNTSVVGRTTLISNKNVVKKSNKNKTNIIVNTTSLVLNVV